MRTPNIRLTLFMVLVSVSQIATGKCVSNGVDICKHADSFAAWLNSNNPRSGEHFRVSRAQSEDGSIKVHFTYLHSRDDFEQMLLKTGQTKEQFEQNLKRISLEAGCKEPARRIVVNGGRFTAIYEFADQTRLYEHTVGSC